MERGSRMIEKPMNAPSSASRREVPLAPYFACALAVGVVASITAYYSLRYEVSPAYGDSHEQGEGPIDYRKWETPKVALIVSGQMHGYIGPCGCSEPQQGGLVRRYNFIQ